MVLYDHRFDRVDNRLGVEMKRTGSGPWLKTHPWLSFEFSTEALPGDVWFLLGESQSKCEHLAGVPLRPDIAATLHRVYLAKGVQATTAIEGNTLTEREVLARIEGNLSLPQSKEYLGREVDNVIVACNTIGRTAVLGDSQELSASDLSEYNRMVLQGLPSRPDVVPGVVRDHAIRVGSYIGPNFEDCASLMANLCSWLNTSFVATKGQDVPMAILKAIIAHVYFVWIHPFSDGNGRTARLLEFRLLLEGGVPTPAAHLLSNYYNQTRSEYYRHLDQASMNGGDLVPFIRYAMSGFIDELREQVKWIRFQQMDVTWRNYVHERFQDVPASAVRDRQLHLVLELSTQQDPVSAGDLAGLTPGLAALYRHKTDKTVTRDVNRLIEMELVERVGTKVRARQEIVAAFLPARRRPRG